MRGSLRCGGKSAAFGRDGDFSVCVFCVGGVGADNCKGDGALTRSRSTGESKGGMRGSLHCGGKSAAFGRDDEIFARDDEILACSLL